MSLHSELEPSGRVSLVLDTNENHDAKVATAIEPLQTLLIDCAMSDDTLPLKIGNQ